MNGEIYIYDDYGSWVDKMLNYYNHNGQPAGYFDSQFNFYDMKGVRVPGGYKGSAKNLKRKQEMK